MQLNFDATKYEPDAGGFGDPIPASWYRMQMDQGEIKPSKTDPEHCAYLNARFEVLEGPFKGRKVFKMFNIKHTNPQTVQIANAQLSALCHAIGRLQIGEIAELQGVPFWGKVKVQTGDTKPEGGKYDDKNDIGTFQHIDKHPPAGASLHGEGGGATGGVAAGGAGAPGMGFANPFAGKTPVTTAAPAPAAAAPTPAAPPKPAAPKPPAPAPAHDPMKAATDDGWLEHPEAPDYMYKGDDVVLKTDVLAQYPAPAAAPAAPSKPAAPKVPTAPAAQAAAPAADATAAQSATPPWAK